MQELKRNQNKEYRRRNECSRPGSTGAFMNQVSWFFTPQINQVILPIQPFFLSNVNLGCTSHAGNKQDPTWPGTLGSVSLSDTALTATRSVVAASLPPVEQHIAAEHTQYPETSQLLSIIVRLHVVFGAAILAWLNFYQSSCGMWVWHSLRL